MPLMHYVRVTRHGWIIVLQSETPTHIIAASTTTEQDVGELWVSFILLQDRELIFINTLFLGIMPDKTAK
jgi:hypothetical protein